MVEQDREADANRLSAAALKAGDPTGWFEQLYAEAAGGQAIVPWDRGEPHPLLVEWAKNRPVPLTAYRTLVVGSGLGEDAAYLSRLGWGVIAFDISPTAIAAARHRFPATPVDFRVADVLDPPQEWTRHFGLVLESYTTQALPVRLRSDGDQARGPVRRSGRDLAGAGGHSRGGPAGCWTAVAAEPARDRVLRGRGPSSGGDRGTAARRPTPAGAPSSPGGVPNPN